MNPLPTKTELEQFFALQETDVIYDRYQLGDEYSKDALAAMEKVVLDREGYQLKKDTQNSNRLIAFFLILGGMTLAKFIVNISFEIFGIFSFLLALAFYFIMNFEDMRLSSYEKKIKKLREKKGMSEIVVSVADQDIEKLRNLVKHGHNIHKITEKGWTALMYAVRLNAIDIAEYLLQCGADLEYVSKDGISAEHLAKKNNLNDMLNLLYKYKKPMPQST